MRPSVSRVGLIVALSACSGARTRPSHDTRGRLRATVTLRAGETLTRRATGRLALTWYTEDEWRALRAGRDVARIGRDALLRTCVAGDVDLERGGATDACAFTVPAGRYVLSAIVDTESTFLETSFGAEAGGFVGASEGAIEVQPGSDVRGEVRVRSVPSHANAEERCTGPRAELMRVKHQPVAGRIGNETNRRLCVHLPASYGRASTTRYPVIWALPGLSGTDTSGFIRSLGAEIDARSAALSREAIVVGVDTRITLGSTYLNDSPVAGEWESFLSEVAVPALDAQYRTMASGSARALVGQSTGGFNAVWYGLRHTDTFSVVGALSPDGLDFERWLLEPDGRRVRDAWLRWTRLEDTMGGAGQMVSYGIAWSPDVSKPRGFVWPFDLTTGEVRDDLWGRWRANSPTVLLADPAVLENVRSRLNGRLYVAVGRHDEFDLFAPAESFHEQLRTVGVEHVFAPDDGGHFPTPERVRGLAEFLLRTLPGAAM